MSVELLRWDVTKTPWPIKRNSVQCVITSPPYLGQRDYGVKGQLGCERTLAEYVLNLADVFDEVRRVLTVDGVCWLNLGDKYNGSGGSGGDYNKGGARWGQPKFGSFRDTRYAAKQLLLAPHRVAIALQERGWFVRMDNVWRKTNPTPESPTDRPRRVHEYVFLLSRSRDYYYDVDATRVAHAERTAQRSWKAGKTRNGAPRVVDPRGPVMGSVWDVCGSRFRGAHFATFPPELIEPLLLASTRPGDMVLDCFTGSGTTGVVARRNGRNFIGLELKTEYLEMARRRIAEEGKPDCRELLS